ncbi:hypothetical protein D9619_011958 [Psilocybe cf. subviscida]|uniref:Uncharacterized protein n=1 Tax=Psilocybe cf. subviscida TaxID=2480587 RepID=A0A8H5B0T7_9AGAR|nr:hypothetical protein D9619_011958 [Psilocybe cf. subviscida]
MGAEVSSSSLPVAEPGGEVAAACVAEGLKAQVQWLLDVLRVGSRDCLEGEQGLDGMLQAKWGGMADGVRPVIREESKPTSRCAPLTKLVEDLQEKIANGGTGERFKGEDYVEELVTFPSSHSGLIFISLHWLVVPRTRFRAQILIGLSSCL